MNPIIVFLLLWIPQPAPTEEHPEIPLPKAAFVASFKSMDECTDILLRVKDKEKEKKDKHQMSCMEVMVVGPTTGESL